jgi:hypothetical protein
MRVKRRRSNRATRTLEALFSNNDAAPTQAAVVTQAPEQLVTDHYAPMIELAQPLEKAARPSCLMIFSSRWMSFIAT